MTEAEKERAAVSVGDYTISATDHPSMIAIVHSSGEGGEFNVCDLEAWIIDFYEKHF